MGFIMDTFSYRPRYSRVPPESASCQFTEVLKHDQRRTGQFHEWVNVCFLSYCGWNLANFQTSYDNNNSVNEETKSIFGWRLLCAWHYPCKTLVNDNSRSILVNSRLSSRITCIFQMEGSPCMGRFIESRLTEWWVLNFLNIHENMHKSSPI